MKFNTCMKCGKKAYLEKHHIVGHCKRQEYKGFHIEICHECHMKEHEGDKE